MCHILSTIGWYQFSFLFLTFTFYKLKHQSKKLWTSVLHICTHWRCIHSKFSKHVPSKLFSIHCAIICTVLHVCICRTIIWLFLYCTLFKASCILMPWEIDHIELKKWCLLQNTMKWLPFFSCIFIPMILSCQIP